MRRTILVVDDAEVNRQILKKLLRDSYIVMEAGDGESALTIIRENCQTLSAVLLDLTMPGMDGYEVLARIIAEPLLSQVPVIVTTGSMDNETQTLALAAGAQDYITKPYDPEIIKHRLGNTIKHRETAAMVNALRCDALTGLLTRESFFRQAEELTDAREPGYYILSCMDIDSFKILNDQHGSAKGDAVLRYIARVFQRDVDSAGGLSCRITADNFALLYPCSLLTSGGLERIRRDITVQDGSIAPLAFSTGRCVVDDKTLPISSIYDRAIIAMTTVKGRFDRNVAMYDESMLERLLHEQNIINDSKQALADSQFEVWYQPQYNHATGALVGAEALVRWRRHDKRLTPPCEFIPVFEKNGFIYELDKYVWEHTCIFLSKQLTEKSAPLPISVNVSRNDIFHDDLIPTLTGLIDKYGVPVELLRLEITESAFAESAERMISVVKELTDLGFSVEIDDFGSGYSSLNTLKNVPAQIVKLDMKFLEDDDGSGRGGNIIESVVRMVKWLGMSLIAEGVETQAQADYLRSIGCVYVQGYLYARPMPGGEYEELLKGSDRENQLSRLETVENLDNNSFWDPASMDTLMFNSYVGGACIAEVNGGKLEFIRINDKYLEELGGGLTASEALSMDLWKHVDGENHAVLLDAVRRAAEERKECACELELTGLPAPTGRVYIRAAVREIARAGSRSLIYCLVTNITAQKESELHIRALNNRLESLMRDMPGGFALMRLRADGTVAMEYVNDSLCALRGMTLEQIVSREGKNAIDAVHPDDVERVRTALTNMIKTGESRNVIYRLECGDGTYRPFNVFGSVSENESGGRTINAYYAELTDRETRELDVRETLPVILSAIMDSTSELSFAKDRSFTYLCCSQPFVKMVGFESDADIVGKTDYELFDKETADRFRADDIKLMEGGQPLIDYVEAIPSDDGIQHYSSTSKFILYDAQERAIGLYGTGRDITDIRAAFERLSLLTDSIPGGIASYIASPAGIRISYFNDGFCAMLGYTREEYERISSTGIMTRTFEEDAPQIKREIDALLNDAVPLNCTYRIRSKSGAIKWVNLRGSVYERLGDTVYINTMLSDVTEQKSTEEALRIHQEEIKLALSKMSRIISEFDIEKRTLTFPDTYYKKYGFPPVAYNVPDSMQKVGGMSDETFAVYHAFYEAVIRGERPEPIEIQKKTPDGKVRWERITAFTVLDDTGKPVKALIAADNTTEQHLAYELERNRPSLGGDDLLVRALFNLGTGETLEYVYRDESEVPLRERTAFGCGEEILKNIIPDDGEREAYMQLNVPAALLERFSVGETEFSLDYRRRLKDGQLHWVRNLLRLIKKPGSDEVLLFEYCYNVDEEKLDALMHSSIVNTNYDYVVRINSLDRSFVAVTNSGLTHNIPPRHGRDSDAAARELAELNVHPDDREMVLKNTLVAGITENLRERNMFQLTFRMLQPDGSVRHKKLTEYYIDRALGILAVTREDITQIMEEAARKSKALAQALESAKQANHARTAFLSRMSHELRTPMNAIIGLSALSAAELDKPEVMGGNIEKIGMSARYLLSLINDILEMSRIESGRMSLAEAPFDFEKLISEVNGIIYSQAEIKGLDYDVTVKSYTEPVYVGDAVKLQEVLLNVLSNAVKFTPAGGKVTLSIEQLRCSGKGASLRFVVTDTGIGIDEKFIPKLFDPFSQEASEYTPTSAGTGLGLAIAKHIVDMMNGQISVKSIKNVGSVFTVDVQLGLSDESRRYLDLSASMKLDRLRAMVVDDDVTVCRSTESILKAIGIEAEWVDSGPAAVSRVDELHREGRDFNVIFIDWKMPDMDGIETTRRIRRIVGPEVTIIIMTAYDWRNIEAEARNAGVDMFMEKPLFQSSVVRAFERVFMANRTLIGQEAPTPVDLGGRRILLAEDHPLNVEVAKRLLERVGAEVTVVGNGLEALETFATEPVGFFDAILMDIRMPEMDGLTATKSIRKLKKDGSRTIPIIAMTANAFDEDVELSLASGMNAHLTKPIEPQILYQTLQGLIRQRDRRGEAPATAAAQEGDS